MVSKSELHNNFFFPQVEPLYHWQQTEDDLTVTIQLSEGSMKDDIQIQFLPENISIVLRDQPFLEGKLYSSIDHESSTWIIKENNRYSNSFCSCLNYIYDFYCFYFYPFHGGFLRGDHDSLVCVAYFCKSRLENGDVKEHDCS